MANPLFVDEAVQPGGSLPAAQAGGGRAAQTEHRGCCCRRSESSVVLRIVVAQFIAILAIGVAVPVYPYVWTYTPMAGGDEVKGGTLNGLGVAINAACEFLSASLLGVLSDRLGRKPFLLMASFGMLVDFAVAGLAVRDQDYALSLPHGHLWMFVARVVAGFSGNMFVFTRAYIGDVSSPQRSATNFAMLYGCIGIGFVMGPPLGALLSRDQLQLAMLVSAALIIVNLCWICRLEESLLERHRIPIQWRKANPVGMLHFLLSSRFLRLFGVMAFLDQFTISLIQTIFLQYTTVAYGVSRGASTSLLIVFGMGQVVAYVAIMRPLVRRCGEVSALKLGYIMSFTAFGLVAFLSHLQAFWALYLVMACFAVGAISNPAQTAIASRCVDPSEQGKLQAATGSLDVVGKMSAALLVFLVWEPSARAGQPGAIWWIAAGVAAPGVYIAFRIQHFLPPRFRDAGGAIGGEKVGKVGGGGGGALVDLNARAVWESSRVDGDCSAPPACKEAGEDVEICDASNVDVGFAGNGIMPGSPCAGAPPKLDRASGAARTSASGALRFGQCCWLWVCR